MVAVHALGPLAPLAAFNQFIVVLLVPLPNGKTNKLPIDHRTGHVSDAHNPDVWTDYGTAAVAAAIAHARTGERHGVGFVLTEADPFVCVDLDNCRTPSGWSATYEDLRVSLPGSVVELSQSGTGLHMWLRTTRMPTHGKKNVPLGIECYSSKRFILLGTQAAGTMVADCLEIHDVVARYFPPRVAGAGDVPDDGPRADWNGPWDNDDLLRRALQSRSAAGAFGGKATFADLYHADAAALARAYPPDANSGEPYDRSSADAALFQHMAFWTGVDKKRMREIAEGSALNRDKWRDREDYIERTITVACGQQRDVLADKKREPAATGAAPADPGRWGIIKEDPGTTARTLLHRRYAHADGARLICWQGTFYEWNGANWQELREYDVDHLVYDFLDRDGGNDYKPKKTNVSELCHALKNVAYFKSESAPPCWVRDDGTRPPPEQIIACANGLLHLPTRTTTPATPQFFSLNAVPFNYEPNAPAPAQWLRFLHNVWPNDSEAIATLQELFGYLLTPDTSQQKIFLIIGPKRSGKGTIARVLTEMLGAANVAGPSLASMAGDFGLQPLIGKQAAIVSDARLGGRTDPKQVAENLLRVSGEDRVDVARKGTTALSLKLGVRFVLLTNELPRIADASGAMASRFVILAMTESFIGREDPGLTSKLLRELPGVLAWAVEGWHRLNARGHFIEPRSSSELVQELADLGSPIGAFVRDECRCGEAAEVEGVKLFDAWRTWCARQGMAHAGTVQTFGRDLRAAYPAITQGQRRVGNDRSRVYRGIALNGTRWHASNSIVGGAAVVPQ